MIERYALPEMRALWSDQTKFEIWLQVELLACEAWAQQGAIPAEALAQIKAKAAFTLERIDAIEAEVHHDVIAFTTALAEQIGEAARFVHMGLTSTDVVDTAQSVRMARSFDLILEQLERVIAVLARRAVEFKHQPIMGRTHGIHAEPTSLGLKFALWHQEMLRNRRRLLAAKETVAVGKISGAVGTYAHTGPAIERYVCEKLGLRPAPIATQVLQRDRHAEALAAVAVCGATIEKIATEIRNLQRTDIYELEEPFRKGQKGSSAMPHKRNPIGCENLTGLARVLRGNLVVALENVALWHERDISHSSAERIILPDSLTLLHYMLHRLAGILEGAQAKPDRMAENLNKTGGLIYSQRILLALIDKGISREDAYLIVQRNAMRTWEDRVPLIEHLLADAEVAARFTREELERLMNPNDFLKYVDEIYRQCGLE
ncbi:MAG TPA: adenylosuccinate lyase [Candidatus Sumerlaeota bacterium]|nr:MAG: Adenylosuccinate lyase [candidate division BRC1 bacterium ADurb.BinA292]HOE96616.1 adenylosuccinate lyase [Candidatus Sumerlaeota bacterium]HOR28249.1 adenylosuccinate lyase [Candidatus Sumerlaeota bacterium]HPK00892.1 adenylosuccinate lyase [Candidatus Sumerlaeota bacterium]